MSSSAAHSDHSDSDSESFYDELWFPSGASKTKAVDRYSLPCGLYYVGMMTMLPSHDCGVDVTEFINKDGDIKGTGEDSTIAEVLEWSEEVEKLLSPRHFDEGMTVVKHKGEDVFLVSFQTSSFEWIKCEVMESTEMKTSQLVDGDCQFFIVSEALLPQAFMKKVDPEGRYGIYVDLMGRDHKDKVDVRLVYNDDAYGLVIAESYNTLLRIHWGSNDSDEDRRRPIFADPVLVPIECIDNSMPDYRSCCTTDLFTLFVALNHQLSDDAEMPLPDHLSSMLTAFMGRDDVKNNTKAFNEVAVELAKRFLRLQTDRDLYDVKQQQRREQKANKKRKLAEDQT